MLNALIRWSLGHRGIVLGLMFLLLAASAYRVPQMPIEVFPELNAPSVTIMTEAPGYAPEEVERAVTFPIETSLNGIAGLRRLRSSSALGLSIVWAEFDFGADIYRNRQLIAERLTRLQGALPANIHAPEMTPIASIAGDHAARAHQSDRQRRVAAHRDSTCARACSRSPASRRSPRRRAAGVPDRVRSVTQRHGLTLAQVEEATASHAGRRRIPRRRRRPRAPLRRDRVAGPPTSARPSSVPGAAWCACGSPRRSPSVQHRFHRRVIFSSSPCNNTRRTRWSSRNASTPCSTRSR